MLPRLAWHVPSTVSPSQAPGADDLLGVAGDKLLQSSRPHGVCILFRSPPSRELFLFSLLPCPFFSVAQTHHLCTQTATLAPPRWLAVFTSCWGDRSPAGRRGVWQGSRRHARAQTMRLRRSGVCRRSSSASSSVSSRRLPSRPATYAGGGPGFFPSPSSLTSSGQPPAGRRRNRVRREARCRLLPVCERGRGGVGEWGVGVAVTQVEGSGRMEVVPSVWSAGRRAAACTQALAPGLSSSPLPSPAAPNAARPTQAAGLAPPVPKKAPRRVPPQHHHTHKKGRKRERNAEPPLLFPSDVPGPGCSPGGCGTRR